MQCTENAMTMRTNFSMGGNISLLLFFEQKKKFKKMSDAFPLWNIRGKKKKGLTKRIFLKKQTFGP